MAAYLSIRDIVKEVFRMAPFTDVNGDYKRAEAMLTHTNEMHLDEWYDWWEEWFHESTGHSISWAEFKDKLLFVAEYTGIALYVVNEDEEVVYVTFDMTRWIEKSYQYSCARAALLDLFKYCNEVTAIKTLDGPEDCIVTRLEMTVRGAATMDTTMFINNAHKDSHDISILFDGGC